MESQIWSKSAEKWAYILMLRGHEVYCLKVTGNVLTLKRNVKAVIDALEQGQSPSDVGAKSVETLDARTLAKAEVSPGNGSLTLHGGGDGSTNLTYATADNNADEILRAILAQCGRTFQPTQEEIGVVEALILPAIVGIVGGLFWAGVYQSAGQIAAGGELEVKGFRHLGLKRLLNSAAELLGTGGTVVVGVLLLVLILGWAAKRIIHRPERTVWLPEKA
ncbi:MAG: hypothetical protein ACHRXM_17875 [Isosphaerales bacterium]